MSTEVLANPFTESFIQSLWDCSTPLQLLGETLVPLFTEAGDRYSESDLELVQILSEFFLHSVAFVKLDLKGTNRQAEKWTELLLQIMHRNILQQNFDAELDFQLFREQLLGMCSGLSPVFTKKQMRILVDHFSTTYIKQIGLYRLTFTQIRPNADIKQTLFIDKPMPFPHLKDAKLIVKEEAKVEQTQELMTEEVADRVKVPLEERLQGLKYPDVDEESQKVVASKVAAARAALQAKMQERQKRLETRLTEAEKDLKKRRK